MYGRPMGSVQIVGLHESLCDQTFLFILVLKRVIRVRLITDTTRPSNQNRQGSQPLTRTQLRKKIIKKHIQNLRKNIYSCTSMRIKHLDTKYANLLHIRVQIGKTKLLILYNSTQRVNNFLSYMMQQIQSMEY